MARTIFGEARGEWAAMHKQHTPLIAIGCVVLNRVFSRKYGASVQDVCQSPYQFSCWNATDPNKSIIQNVTPKDPVFVLCQKIAHDLLQGIITHDPTHKSTHYHHQNLRPLPHWAEPEFQQAHIGHHIFYKLP